MIRRDLIFRVNVSHLTNDHTSLLNSRIPWTINVESGYTELSVHCFHEDTGQQLVKRTILGLSRDQDYIHFSPDVIQSLMLTKKEGTSELNLNHLCSKIHEMCNDDKGSCYLDLVCNPLIKLICFTSEMSLVDNKTHYFIVSNNWNLKKVRQFISTIMPCGTFTNSSGVKLYDESKPIHSLDGVRFSFVKNDFPLKLT